MSDANADMITSHHMAGVFRVTQEVASMGARDLVGRVHEMVKRSGLTAVGEACADLLPQGASCVVLLTESHVAVHAWPEHRCLTVDIHVCDYHAKNLALAEGLATEISAGFSADTTVVRWHTHSVREIDGNIVDSSLYDKRYARSLA